MTHFFHPVCMDERAKSCYNFVGVVSQLPSLTWLTIETGSFW